MDENGVSNSFCMKIYIRGGAWTNIEDQILLAAYMKYGGNQWLRIASLLPKHSASQVKARWEEYLDPTLRKSPWSNKEDEKLLHLARIMPMQWRSISQYFGRSAYQCVERYRELIDKASGTPHIADNESAVEHGMMPNYETLDSIPDAVELTQEEKEMLAEARARLANTQGKKARRKARERQLEVLRKVTALKKKRELEAAGLVVQEKNLWEDKEYEIDVITTHKPKDAGFEVFEETESEKLERIKRIKAKIDENKKRKVEIPLLDKLKQELKKEEAILEVPVDTHVSSLVLPDPQITEEEYKLIEFRKRLCITLDHESIYSLRNFLPEESIEEQEEIIPFQTNKELEIPFPLSYQMVANDDDYIEKLVDDETMKIVLRDCKNELNVVDPPIAYILPTIPNLEKEFLEDITEEFRTKDILETEELIQMESRDIVIDEAQFSEEWDELHPAQSFCLPDLQEKLQKQRNIAEELRKKYQKKLKYKSFLYEQLIKKMEKIDKDIEDKRTTLTFQKSLKEIETKIIEQRRRKLEAATLPVKV